jgi:SUN family beta-glucosidase
MKFSRIALLSAATLTAAQPHNHLHRHKNRQGSPVQGRDVVTTVVAGPVTTEYVLDGTAIPYDVVEAGIANGIYVLIGETISTVIPAAPSSASPTSSSSEAAEFLQVASTSTTPTPTPTPAPVTTQAAPAPATTASAAPAPVSSSSSGNVNSNFPSGTIACSDFPSSYGPVPADWLGLGGWTGVQNVPGFTFDVDAAISHIDTAISGSSCTPGSFCSYACPPGYQKSQWPTAQGSTGQSVGGLFCNSNGFLELSRTSVSQLCTAGVGNVQVTSSLSANACICRTDYPGTEGETIPLNVGPGETLPVTCPDANNYYMWEGAFTSAQYYLNPSGTPVDQACQWGTPGGNTGNWAPVNMGVGQGSSGETFISLFPNTPTNTYGELDYDITITGGVSGDCEYKMNSAGTGRTYWSNGVESPTGCTVSRVSV